MRLLVALAIAAVFLAEVAAPHHHPAGGPQHECAACTVGGGLEARDATPRLVRPVAPVVAEAGPPAVPPVTGAPRGAVPGQSPPA